MLTSSLIFVVAVALLVGVAVLTLAAHAEKLGQRKASSIRSRERTPVGPARPRLAYEPQYCYNDCIRAHERTDPNFPCSVACGVQEGSRV
jgi:hypothetical protein